MKALVKSEAKPDVSGFITSAGGGTTIRNALASEIPYGEVALPGAIAAIQQGGELSIVHGRVLSGAAQGWGDADNGKSGVLEPADALLRRMVGRLVSWKAPLIRPLSGTTKGRSGPIRDLKALSARFDAMHER